MSIEIKSDILAKELNQGIVPLGVPKAYQYDAALVEAARAAVNQGIDDVAEAGDTAVNSVKAQESTSTTNINTLGDKILAQMKHGYGYPFTAASAAAMTDTAKIYVYTGSETGYTNGNWYYWNGTAWTSGGVYNATALETDKTLTVSGAAADAFVVGETTANVNQNLLRKYGVVNKKLIQLSTNDYKLEDSDSYDTSDFIPIYSGVKLNISRFRTCLFFDNTKHYIRESYISTEHINYVITPQQDGYVRFSYNVDEYDIPTCYYGESNSNNVDSHKHLADDVHLGNEQYTELNNAYTKKESLNILNDSASIDGYIGNSRGDIIDSDVYKTTDFIYLKRGQKIIFGMQIRKFIAYYVDKQRTDTTSHINDATDDYEYTAVRNCYVRASYNKAYSEIAAAYYDSKPQYFQKYGNAYLDKQVHLSDASIDDVKEMITSTKDSEYAGKCWFACGDSFTADGYGTTDQPKIEDGIYKGMNVVYPFIIGNRTGMEIHNLARGGMTLASIDGYTNSFTANRIYEQISNPDIITLWFGINDEHQSVPVGTIDSTDTSTFMGAYNVVMTYLTTNFPNAHIGIVATNGCTTLDIPNAAIAIAKKWGAPYLDMNNDPAIPLMIRSLRTEASAESKLRVTQHQSVSYPSNQHPNAEAHRFQSWFIEHWIKSL